MEFSRRQFLQSGSAALVLGPLATRAQTGPSVVIIGGGFGGATAAKYLKRFNPAIRVTLI